MMVAMQFRGCYVTKAATERIPSVRYLKATASIRDKYVLLTSEAKRKNSAKVSNSYTERSTVGQERERG